MVSFVLLFNINHWFLSTEHVATCATTIENQRIALLQLGNNFLAVLHLHEGWLKGLDGKQDVPTELLTSDNLESLLEHIVSKLIVDKFLDDEADARFEALGSLALVAELVDDLHVVLFQGPSEYLVDV